MFKLLQNLASWRLDKSMRLLLLDTSSFSVVSCSSFLKRHKTQCPRLIWHLRPPLIMPALELQLIPHLSCEARQHSLFVRMILHAPSLTEDDTLFHHVLCRGPTETQQYSAQDISIFDSAGSKVSLRSQDSKDGRHRTFHCTSDVSAGPLTVEYQAIPWNPTETPALVDRKLLLRETGEG